MAGEPQRNHRATAIAVSIAAHAVATGLLVWRMGTAPPQVEPPVMNVQLANLARHRPANVARAPAPGAPPAVAPTLRALLGCEHARVLDLSAEERERCRDRLAAEGARARGTQAARLNLDRRGDFTANPETYLNRIPTKGCKPRVAGDVAPGPGRSGGPQGPEAGATCVIPF
jgi:hypothetical protein